MEIVYLYYAPSSAEFLLLTHTQSNHTSLCHQYSKLRLFSRVGSHFLV